MVDNEDEGRTTPGAEDSDGKGLREGDHDPILNKTVRTLIIDGLDYSVYLDENLYVQWYGSEEAEKQVYSSDGGSIIHRISHLETVSSPLEGTEHLEPLRRLLGESLARLLCKDAKSAEKILDKAESYLRARTAELARTWYLSSSALVGGIALAFLIIAWVFRTKLTSIIGRPALDVAMGAALGAVGALMSILARTSRIEMEAGAGRLIHQIEGAARVFAGSVGAVFVGLATRANMIHGILEGEASLKFPFFLLMCLAAGASERLVPGLIHKIEESPST